jgi:hypothetical protein
LRREAESLLLAHEAGGRALDSQMLWRHARTSGGSQVPETFVNSGERMYAHLRISPAARESPPTSPTAIVTSG